MDLRRRNALLQERDTLLSEAEAALEAAGEAGLTEEQATRDDEIHARVGVIDQEIARIERTVEARRNAPAVASFPGNGEQPRAEGSNHVRDLGEDEPWPSLGAQLQAIAFASMPHGERDVRLQAVSGASAGNPSSGGFLIGTEYTTELLNKAREESQLMGLCRRWPVAEGNDGIEYPFVKETSRATGSRWGGVRVYRKKEAATVEASRPEIDMSEIRLYEMMGLAYATERLLRNAPTLRAIFSDAFASEFAMKIDEEILYGSGVGECLGILNTANNNKVIQTKEDGQAAATIQPRNLSNMWTHVPARLKPRSRWFVNGEVTPELDELVIPAGSGGTDPRIVRYNDQGAMLIKGRPVTELEWCEAIGTQGDIILADFNEYLLITQGDLEQAESMHVRFVHNEMAFRWNYYINGQPLIPYAVTPVKGNATQSPFVALESRL